MRWSVLFALAYFAKSTFPYGAGETKRALRTKKVYKNYEKILCKYFRFKYTRFLQTIFNLEFSVFFSSAISSMYCCYVRQSN